MNIYNLQTGKVNFITNEKNFGDREIDKESEREKGNFNFFSAKNVEFSKKRKCKNFLLANITFYLKVPANVH